MIDLKGNPFFLDEEQIAWVEMTLNGMSTDEKLSQLFCLEGSAYKDASYLEELSKRKAGGIMFRSAPIEKVKSAIEYLQNNSEIPLLLPANLESGGVGLIQEATDFGSQMQIAATGDTDYAYKLGYVSCAEANAVGGNMAFAPVVDINYNWRNPITCMRTYGSNPETVKCMASAYLKGANDAGCAVTIKHFPGDGVDERDQHLHITTNDLSAKDWYATYGNVYKTLIDNGAGAVMVGHIAGPNLIKEINPNATKEDCYLPASLSKTLITDVLRNKLGFNGVVFSDATLMGGYICAMPREQAVPLSIACGIDMFLFSISLEEDMQYMKAGFDNGIITKERLNDAVTRILALKASLGLNLKRLPTCTDMNIINCKQFKEWKNEGIDKAITLVKDTNNLLPINNEKHKRVLLFTAGQDDEKNRETELKIADLLKSEGFIVTCITPDIIKAGKMPISYYKDNFDLAFYIFNYNWINKERAVQQPWFCREIPTIGISFGSPYHLIDAPQLSLYINAYSFSDTHLKSVFEKLLGKSEFTGVSPIDPFCEREDIKIW